MRWSSFKEGEPTIRWFILELEKRGLSAGVIADLRSSAHEISECNQILLAVYLMIYFRELQLHLSSLLILQTKKCIKLKNNNKKATNVMQPA